jgi:transcriptional regulator with XRE-family HTH domain
VRKSEFQVSLGDRLRTARTNCGLSQSGLGNLMDLSRSTITNVEAGRQGVSAHDVLLYSEILRVDPGWLLAGDRAPAPGPVLKAGELDQVVSRMGVALTEMDGVLSFLASLADEARPPRRARPASSRT